MTYTNGQLRQIYKGLPQDVRELIASIEYDQKIKSIAQKFNLLTDKAGILSAEITSILMGTSSRDSLAATIKEKMELSEDESREMATEVSKIIFEDVRESLKNVHENPAYGRNAESPHEIINKDDLLASIENPAPSEARVEKPMLPAEARTVTAPVSQLAAQVAELPKTIATETMAERKIPIKTFKEMTEEPVVMAQSSLRTMEGDIKKASERTAEAPLAAEQKIEPKAFEEAVRPSPNVLEAVPPPKTASNDLAIADAKLNNPIISPKTIEVKRYEVDPYREPL